MNKTITASLDFNKALKNFESTTIRALELTQVTEWDGKNLKEREEKIRQAALIKAGRMYSFIVV